MLPNFKTGLLKEKKKFIKGDSWIKPARYWRFALAVTLFLVLAGFVFSYYLFENTSREVWDPVLPAAETEDMIGKRDIEKALEYFKERENLSKKIIDSPASVIDPSI